MIIIKQYQPLPLTHGSNSDSTINSSGCNFRWVPGLSAEEPPTIAIDDFNAIKRLLQEKFGRGRSFDEIEITYLHYDYELKTGLWNVIRNGVVVGHIDKNLEPN